MTLAQNCAFCGQVRPARELLPCHRHCVCSDCRAQLNSPPCPHCPGAAPRTPQMPRVDLPVGPGGGPKREGGMQTYPCDVVDDCSICKLADLLPEIFGTSASEAEMQRLRECLDCLRTFVLTNRPLQSVTLNFRREGRRDAPWALSIQCPPPCLCELEVTPSRILLDDREITSVVPLPPGVLVADTEWECLVCTFTNVNILPYCEACGGLRGQGRPAVPTPPPPPPPLADPGLPGTPVAVAAPAPGTPSVASSSSSPVVAAPPPAQLPGPSSPTDSGVALASTLEAPSSLPSDQPAPPPPLAETLVSPPAEDWQCEVCTLINNPTLLLCLACGGPRPPAQPRPASDGGPTGSAAPLPGPPSSAGEEEWLCAICTLMNAASLDACLACGEGRGTPGLFDHPSPEAPPATAAATPSPEPLAPPPDLGVLDVGTLPDTVLGGLLPPTPLAVPVAGEATPTPAPTVAPAPPAAAEGPASPQRVTVDDLPAPLAVPASPLGTAAAVSGPPPPPGLAPAGAGGAAATPPPAPGPAPLPGACQCPLHRGVYQKERHIGRGATGDVFLARYGDRQVALKQILVPNRAEREELLIRADLYQQLEHPNIIRYEDCFEHQDEYRAQFVIIVMPFYPLGEVTTLLEKTPRLEEKLLLRIGAQVADALRYLHSLRPNPIVHRDLKPENLLWDGENVVLTDLETIRFMDATFVRGATGTYPYQPPEQIERGVTSEKSDIWALGCVLFAMACKPPYPDIMHIEVKLPGRNFSAWVKERLQARDYSRPFADAVLMMLRADPSKRITAGQVRDHCHRLLVDLM